MHGGHVLFLVDNGKLWSRMILALETSSHFVSNDEAGAQITPPALFSAFVFSMAASIANVQKLNNITNENVNAGKRHITTFGDLGLTRITPLIRHFNDPICLRLKQI